MPAHPSDTTKPGFSAPAATGVPLRPQYLKVLQTFARNSLVRDMTFRANFLIDAITSLIWMGMNLGFYVIIFQYTPSIGLTAEGEPGWGKFQFFTFMATTAIINSLVQTFFMPNVNEFSELIRTGSLDSALVKPIDTQFLISLQRIEWSSLGNLLFAVGLLGYSLWQLDYVPSPLQWLLYPVYLLCGVAILYSLMIVLASVSILLGRNQSLYDFWFYITIFLRYPMEIYHGRFGTPLRTTFTWFVPVLVVVNVPARLMAWPLSAQSWPLAAYTLIATAGCLWGSRRVFQAALGRYRSASS